MTLREGCFPGRARRVPWARLVSLPLRAVHLAAVALLLGGHAYGAPAEALTPWLLMAVASGLGLMVPELVAWGLYWFALGKGGSVVVKLALLLAIPLAWEARVPILVLAVLWAGVTAHMPARWRNYSFLHGRILDATVPLRRTPSLAAGGWPLRATRRPPDG